MSENNYALIDNICKN